ncbi:DUF4174 domain-containing protein [Sphingomonas qilianensis]|uniref:DUF4174 domain-containing protein n=2 Tax=Sphingomonas qilianensis TaxID=1736690 RepID=A0ABU9XU25_9SPHN
MTAPSTTISTMKWEKRVLLVSVPNANDPLLNDQRRIIARWRSGAEERDLAIVEIVGDKVIGAIDPAASLRRRYVLPRAGFTIVLIRKDGSAKLRGTRPISAAMLRTTIDAMRMRLSDRR